MTDLRPWGLAMGDLELSCVREGHFASRPNDVEYYRHQDVP